MIRTCPMRSEGQQDRPGNCPICGVMLEPSIPLDAENNHELKDFQPDFWWTLTLTVIVTALAMSLSSGLGHLQRIAAAACLAQAMGFKLSSTGDAS